MPAGIAFGGPPVYGDQRGDERRGCPAICSGRRCFPPRMPDDRIAAGPAQAVRIAQAPRKTRIESCQGAGGRFVA